MIKLTDYVQTADEADILGVAQNTLRKWAERGGIAIQPTGTDCLNEVIWKRF